MEEVGFDEIQPLKSFENTLNFYSLRKYLSEKEEEWLNSSEELNIEEDPTNGYEQFLDEELTLLNCDGEVMIGKSIYKFTNEGYYEITDGNLKTLLQLDNLKSINNLPENVIFKNGNNNKYFCKSGGCNSNKSSRGYKSNSSGNRKIKWVVSHWTHPWGRRVMAKTKNYKKTGRWIKRWKKYTTYCWARVYGKISGKSGNCSDYYIFNTSNGSYASANAKKVKHYINVSTKTKSGWVKAQFYGAGGIYYTKTLTW